MTSHKAQVPLTPPSPLGERVESEGIEVAPHFKKCGINSAKLRIYGSPDLSGQKLWVRDDPEYL